MRTQLRAPSRLCFLVAAFIGTQALAGNGLNDIGYGSESSSMAGIDLALARDSAALNTNPAGLTQIENQVLDVLLEPYSYIGVRHKDAFGNDVAPENKEGAAAGGGYARRIPGTNLVAGVGLFFQGGAGFVYELDTPFGARDELSSLFGSLKIAPGLAWQIDERWSVGGSVGVLYSSARQKVYFETSTESFSGLRIDDLAGLSANVKLGLQYRPTPAWVLAAAYTSEGPIRLEDGTMRINNTGSTGGFLNYRDVRVRGLAFAQELGIGARYHVNPRWSVVGEINWLDWSSAMKSTTLTARNPDVRGAPPRLIVETPLKWRDQYVFGLGTIYQWTPATELRAGLSFGRNPVPDETLSPTFALIGDTSICAGFQHKLGPLWNLAVSAVYQPPIEQDYVDPLLGRSSERWEVTGAYITFSRRW